MTGLTRFGKVRSRRCLKARLNILSLVTTVSQDLDYPLDHCNGACPFRETLAPILVFLPTLFGFSMRNDAKDSVILLDAPVGGPAFEGVPILDAGIFQRNRRIRLAACQTRHSRIAARDRVEKRPA